MSSLLHRLGHWCAQHAARVLAAWLLVIVAMAGIVGLTGMNLSSAFTLTGSESMKGLSILAQRLPQAAGTSEQVLFTSTDGGIESHKDAIESLVDKLGELDGVAMVSDPFGSEADQAAGTPAQASTVSEDGTHVIAQIQADTSIGSMAGGQTPKAKALSASIDSLIASAEKADPGLTIQSGGTIGESVDIGLGATELLGVLLAAIVLLATFGSLLAAGAPLIAAFVGVGAGMLGILVVANAIDINSVTPVLAVMIGLAVGIDYALFIISRAREYLAQGIDPREAAGRATATAGSAVVFAGTTVVVALCGLAVARIPFLTVMGCASAAVVAGAVLVALTVVPALIGLIGERLRPNPLRARRQERRAAAGRRSFSQRWVHGVTRSPVLTILAVIAVLAVTAIPITSLRLALTDNGFANKGTQQRVTYDAIAEAYGPGYNSPIIVIADIVNTTDPITTVDTLAKDIEKLPGVADVALATPNEDGSLALVQIRPEKGQADDETMDLVRTIRANASTYEKELGITDVMVTGQTAVAIDVSSALDAALLPFGIVVVGLSLILLMVVFRSIAVPVTATLGYLLSLAAGMGAVGAVWGWGWFADAINVSKTGAVISFMPVIVMGVLFGLAMDYEVFLVSRMREEWMRANAAGRTGREAAHHAVEAGFVGSAKVVTAAAVIMTGVFAAFIPSHNIYIKPIAVALTVGIAADAFLVRMTLIPALMHLLGERAWWLPAWLERQLPVIDVEGEGLERTLANDEWTAAHGHVALRADGVTLADSSGAAIRGLDLTVAPGEIALVRTATPLARRALAAAIGGRLQPSRGTLVVDNHVLPDGTASIQSVTTSVHAYDDVIDPRVKVVVVADPGERRWKRIGELAGAGVAVVVPAAAEAPAVAPGGLELASVIDVAADGTAVVRRAPERVAPAPPQTEGETTTEPASAVGHQQSTTTDSEARA